MTNCEALSTDPVQLAPEDQLWSGLTFEVIDGSEMPAQHQVVGDQVHYHRGVWWKQLNRFFCMPCSTFATIDPERSWPEWHRSIAGYVHLSAPGTKSNSTYRAIVNDSVKRYSIQSLGSRRNAQQVRRALNKVEVRVVTIDTLLKEGFAVYASWHERVGWGRDRSRESFDTWIRRACSRPKRIVLGAFAGDKLAAFMLPYATGGVVCPSFIASHTEFLKFRPNDALHHAVLCIARQTPDITMADFGPFCSKPTLNDFKLRFGKVREFPAYTRMNWLLTALAAKRLQDRYPWLSSNATREGPTRQYVQV